ncbi:MAG: putative Na+/H+ antiporter, partial [Myxococcota bacterium]
CGGGLTVIANAPNPAGQALLARFFGDGVSPGKLLIGAFIPTVIVSLVMMLFPDPNVAKIFDPEEEVAIEKVVEDPEKGSVTPKPD